MTANQEAHLKGVTNSVICDLDKKYRKGQQEHGGDIWKKGLQSLICKELRAEAIDLLVYTHELQQGLNEIKEIVLFMQQYSVDTQIDCQRLLDILNGTIHTD